MTPPRLPFRLLAGLWWRRDHIRRTLVETWLTPLINLLKSK